MPTPFSRRFKRSVSRVGDAVARRLHIIPRPTDPPFPRTDGLIVTGADAVHPSARSAEHQVSLDRDVSGGLGGESAQSRPVTPSKTQEDTTCSEQAYPSRAISSRGRLVGDN